jgi:hypothetical protein
MGRSSASATTSTGRRRRAPSFQGLVLVFGSDAGLLVSRLRDRGFEVLSARREDEVAALAEAVPIEAIVVDHVDPTEAYSSLLTVSLRQPSCRRVLVTDGKLPASLAEYVDAKLPRSYELADLVWLLRA